MSEVITVGSLDPVVIQRGDGLHLIIQRGLPGAPGQDGVSADWNTLPNKPAVIAAGDTVQEARDAIGLGTLVMADISDKQGKVLDDRIPISNWEDVRDGIKTKGGYLLANDGTNGYLFASLVDVVETGGVVAQAINSPIFGQMSRYYTEDNGWSEFLMPVTSLTVRNWYYDTTAEAANAVIDSNGFCRRSTFDVVATLAAKLDADQVGVANGVASLDASGKVPAAQLPVTGGGVPEAPSDGKTYGRKDADWVEIAGGGGGAADWNTLANKPAVIGAGSSLAGAQAALGIVVSTTAPTSPAEGTIWIKVA